MTSPAETAELPPIRQAPGGADDRPRPVRPGRPLADHVFRTGARGTGLGVLAIMGAIGAFLFLEFQKALAGFGWSFFTESRWLPETGQIGIVAVLVGTILVAAVAIAVACPLALLTALFITEYAPQRAKRMAIALVDLMAAVPSVVYGLWGFFLLQGRLIAVSRWLHGTLGAYLPLFDVDTDPDAAIWDQASYTSSAFIAGVVVAMMVLPICASVMREVFDQTPAGEREAALALGATRWGVIRMVVLPFGRGGIIGGTMLGLGRALGETIAVALVISAAFDVKFQILESGTITIASNIALRFGEAAGVQLAALMASGLVLFVFTLVVNTLAAIVVARSRSGAATEI